MSELDDEYKLAAQNAEAEELDRSKNRGKGSNFTFDHLQWFGLEPKKTKVVRFIGNPSFLPSKNVRKPSDCKVVRIAKILDDKGSAREMILPEDTDHVVWQLINRVKDKGRFIETPNDPDGKKGHWEYPNKTKHPEVFAIIERSNIPLSEDRVKIGLEGYGWEGRKNLIANIIDRTNYAWHKENKHTALLSKNVNIKKNDDGTLREFIDKGVPFAGLSNVLNKLIGDEGNWSKYDVAIDRTGLPHFI